MQLFGYRFCGRRISIAENDRPQGARVIYVFVTIHVKDVASLTTLQVDGSDTLNELRRPFAQGLGDRWDELFRPAQIFDGFIESSRFSFHTDPLADLRGLS